MKIILFVSLLLPASLLFGQVTECYCYENKDTKYSEWLVYEKDSVAILAMKNKTCSDDIPGLSSIDTGRLKSLKYPYIEDDGVIYIVKSVEIPGFNTTLKTYYSGVRKGDNLEVNIKSTSSFRDMIGPPERLYKKIILK